MLREKDLPLYSLENKRGLNEFDMIGFSLQYELSYTNILTILELGRVPLYSKDRTEDHTLIIGGGPCTFNPEPLRISLIAFLLAKPKNL